MAKTIHSAQYKTFLKVLRNTRQRVGLTQTELAEEIGKTQTYVSKCERGERRIDVLELRTFCAALGLSMKQFVAKLEEALRQRG